jgi:hypothetical protein
VHAVVKVAAINLVDDTTELMVISQFGKIIRSRSHIFAKTEADQGLCLCFYISQD